MHFTDSFLNDSGLEGLSWAFDQPISRNGVDPTGFNHFLAGAPFAFNTSQIDLTPIAARIAGLMSDEARLTIYSVSSDPDFDRVIGMDQADQGIQATSLSGILVLAVDPLTRQLFFPEVTNEMATLRAESRRSIYGNADNLHRSLASSGATNNYDKSSILVSFDEGANNIFLGSSEEGAYLDAAIAPYSFDTEIYPLAKYFDKASDQIKTYSTSVSDEDLLVLYGLYKQSVFGDIDIDKPSFYQINARAKYASWEANKGKSQAQARQEYVDYCLKFFPADVKKDYA